MKKAALHNLGCKVNAYETEAMQEILEKGGYEIVPFSSEADVYVINTCSVTNIADRKSRQMIHRARKANPEAVIVACGCYVQTAKEELLSDGTADIIIGNNKKHELLDRIAQFCKNKSTSREAVHQEVSYETLDGGQPFEELIREKSAEHTRAFIKVQDGCNQFCAYCIIPYARGRVRSRDRDDVLREVESLAAVGYQEIVLTGIHLSSYGIDTDDSLLGLIEAINEIKGIKRIRLGSLEPRIITEKFVKRLSEMHKFCPHFHLSLQSGCDETLKRMNRHYTAGEYEEKCDLIRRYFTHPAITTDVIVGFPGETREDFEASLAFAKKVHFYEMHVFKYSKRDGTRAAVMPNQVPEQEKAIRSTELIACGEKMTKEFRDWYLGREVEALLEETTTVDGMTYMTGFTKEYVKVACMCDASFSGRILRGKIEKCLNAELYLMVEI